MTSPSASRLAVLGSPITHSKSPVLHRAAYAELGLDWSYEPLDIGPAGLADFLSTRDASWRGLSLTMPLKREVLPFLTTRDARVASTGSANTVLFGDHNGTRTLAGFNTDVFGITEALRLSGHPSPRSVLILGGGATAASAIAAAHDLGAETIRVAVRSLERSGELHEVARRCGTSITLLPLSALSSETPGEHPDAVISTLPNGIDADIQFAPGVSDNAVLLDVAYDPWPSALAKQWTGDLISGLEMLILQALMQVRIFVNADPNTALPREGDILAAMRAAVADPS